MFVSADYLSTNYGVDDAIARYFVDRDPPKDNLYWHGKLLYLRPSPGYLFIPLIFDLLYKLGLEKNILLDHFFVSTMEQTGHISAMEELKLISQEEAIDQCAEMVRSVSVNNGWFEEVYAYLKKRPGNKLMAFATPLKSLHRGDMFLFSTCVLPLRVDQRDTLAQLWFALITSLLLLDDADDLQNDLLTGELNAYVESGLNEAGYEVISSIISANTSVLARYNKILAHQIKTSFELSIQLPSITQILNSN